MYRYYIQRGGTLSFSAFTESKYFSKDFLDWQRLVDHYIKLFGADNVLLIKGDIDQCAVDRIADFIGAPTLKVPLKRVNKSLAYAGVHLLRLHNRFRKVFFNTPELTAPDERLIKFLRIFSYLPFTEGNFNIK